LCPGVGRAEAMASLLVFILLILIFIFGCARSLFDEDEDEDDEEEDCCPPPKPPCPSLQHQITPLQPRRHCLRPIPHVQLPQDIIQVILYRALRDPQGARDFLVAVSARD
jgi:hypothetical protein